MNIKNHSANSFQIDHAGVKTTPAENVLKVIFMITFAILVICFIGLIVFNTFSLPIGKQDSEFIFTQPLDWTSFGSSKTTEGDFVYGYSYSGKIKNISDKDLGDVAIVVVFNLENGTQEEAIEPFTNFKSGVEKYVKISVKTSSPVKSHKAYVVCEEGEFNITNIKGLHKGNVILIFFGVLALFVIECFIIVGIDKRKRRIRRMMPSNNIVVVDKDGIKNDVHLDQTDASKIVKCIYCGTFNYKENYRCKGCGSLLERSVRNEEEYYQEEV